MPGEIPPETVFGGVTWNTSPSRPQDSTEVPARWPEAGGDRQQSPYEVQLHQTQTLKLAKPFVSLEWTWQAGRGHRRVAGAGIRLCTLSVAILLVFYLEGPINVQGRQACCPQESSGGRRQPAENPRFSQHSLNRDGGCQQGAPSPHNGHRGASPPTRGPAGGSSGLSSCHTTPRSCVLPSPKTKTKTTNSRKTVFCQETLSGVQEIWVWGQTQSSLVS